MKEHYTITLEHDELRWVLHFDNYFKWVLSAALMRLVLRLCADRVTPAHIERDEFPAFIEERGDPTEGYEPVRFVEGSSIDLNTLADDEMTLPEPPNGWRVYKRKSVA